MALDLDHLIEEVADLDKSERFAVRSQLRRIIEHSLKLTWSPAREPRPGWHESIIDARTSSRTSSRRRCVAISGANPEQFHAQARRNAEGVLRAHGEHRAVDQLPVECPYRFADLLRYPETATACVRPSEIGVAGAHKPPA